MEIAATAVKAGTMVATGGVMADAVIFSDVSYLYLALVGALVSGFGVMHDLFGAGHEEHSVGEIAAELIKGIALGVLAIPFWYLTLTGIGGDALHEYLSVSKNSETFTSLSLIVSFGLSWFTVPIFDFLAKAIPNKVARLFGKGD